MNNKINNKVQLVKSEHQQLIEIAQKEIMENSTAFQEDKDAVLTALDYDEKSIKKLEAIQSAQELITSLTEQIQSAKSAQEVIDLRKKLNYYINKIKGELKRRCVSEEVLDNYQSKASSLRKSIALYLRFLKREDNINKISTLSSNFDNLTEEELLDLKKCLQKENRYNKRNINTLNEDSQKTEVQNATAHTETSNPTTTPLPTDEDIDTEEPEDEFAFVLDSDEEDEFTSSQYEIKYISEDTPYEETDGFFTSKINEYNKMFGVVETLDYTKGQFSKNAVIFCLNIPRYIHNKIAIQKMEKGFYYFYSGNDFASYIEYMKRRNSIHEALKYIFQGTCLFSGDDVILGEHENCARWMHDFCAKQELPIFVRKRQTVPVE